LFTFSSVRSDAKGDENVRTCDERKRFSGFPALWEIVFPDGREILREPGAANRAKRNVRGFQRVTRYRKFLREQYDLIKFGTRYDDPSLSLWTQHDPVGGSLGDLNSANRYAYANDDPVNLVDPSGKGWWDCVWVGVDIASIGFGAVIAIATAIVTFVYPNAITVFFAVAGILLVIEGYRGLVLDIPACFPS
jgi:RHS repeat-associated protein